MRFDNNKLYLGDRFSKIFTIVHYPSNADMGWLARLIENTGAIFSINIEPTDNTELIENLDARVREASSLSKIAKNESIKQMREAEVKEASDIISRMINNNEVVSYLTIYICVSAQEEKELNLKCDEVKREVQKLNLKLRPMTNYTLRETLTKKEYNLSVDQNVLVNWNETMEYKIEIQTTASQEIKYNFVIKNTGNVPLSNFTWTDSLPTDYVRITKLITGTYNQDLNYSIYYKTNKSDYRLLKDNLNTQVNNYIDFSNIF